METTSHLPSRNQDHVIRKPFIALKLGGLAEKKNRKMTQ